jgi:hypothetical protein
MRRSISLALACGLALLASGCANVKAWERADLARPDMAWDVDGVTASQSNHIYFSKEGSLPGASAGGGGCGCN